MDFSRRHFQSSLEQYIHPEKQNHIDKMCNKITTVCPGIPKMPNKTSFKTFNICSRRLINYLCQFENILLSVNDLQSTILKKDNTYEI